jgi:hypothetical protein
MASQELQNYINHHRKIFKFGLEKVEGISFKPNISEICHEGEIDPQQIRLASKFATHGTDLDLQFSLNEKQMIVT